MNEGSVLRGCDREGHGEDKNRLAQEGDNQLEQVKNGSFQEAILS